MSTASLRRDHDLIEKVVISMKTTIQMLQSGKTIPESIMAQVIDFSKNFTDVCHHGKEECSLFPALEKAGMPTNMGPIAMMLQDHEKSRQIAAQMETANQKYLNEGDSTDLITSMQQYVVHITEHLWKENNRLFMMAEARLQGVAQKVNSELEEIEDSKLKETGKDRTYYENIVKNLSEHAATNSEISADWED